MINAMTVGEGIRIGATGVAHEVGREAAVEGTKEAVGAGVSSAASCAVS